MKTILVVEDSAQIRTLVGITIKSMGHVPMMASNGKVGWEILADNPDIDLMLVDMLMPVMDGREFIRLVRSNDDFTHIPIIIMSAIMGVKDIGDLLDLGASLFLPKPLAMADLKEYITNSLQGSAD